MPIPTVAIQIEGVLRKTVTRAPLDMGKRLYHALAAEYNLVLVTEDADREQSKTWLAMEGFSKHAHVQFCTIGYSPEYWLAAVKMLKLQYGYAIEYVIQPDPVTAELLIRKGFNSMLVTNAAYALPEWRPDSNVGVEKWDSMVAEVDRQRQLRAEDKRMEGH
jgi:hypothetical protein